MGKCFLLLPAEDEFENNSDCLFVPTIGQWQRSPSTAHAISHGGSLGLRRFSIDSVELRMVGVTEWRTVKQGCQTHSRIRGEQRYL